MRLIDEEELSYGGKCKVIDGDIYIKASDVNKWLKTRPTAYDLDKVVEQLEKEKKSIRHNPDVKKGLMVAIEIVKGGA